MNDGLKKLQAGPKMYFHGYDKGRGFDKYQVSEKAPADMTSVSFTATFYTDKDGSLKLKTENARDPADKARIYPVEMTYGGAVYKQRYLYPRRRRDLSLPAVQHRGQGLLRRPHPQALARLPRRLAVRRGERQAERSAQGQVLRDPVRVVPLHRLHAHPDGGGRLHRRRGQRPERRDGHRRRRRAQRAQHRLRDLPRRPAPSTPRPRAAQGVDDREPGQARLRALDGDLQPVPQPPAGHAEERPADQQGRPHAHPRHQPQRVPGEPHDARGRGAERLLARRRAFQVAPPAGAPTWSARSTTSTRTRSSTAPTATTRTARAGIKFQLKAEARDGKNSLCATCHKVDMKEHTAEDGRRAAHRARSPASTAT